MPSCAECNSISSVEKVERVDTLSVVQVSFDNFDTPHLHKDLEAFTGVFEDDSPYPEVRSAVANTDDTSIPCGTIRAWVLGIIWAILIPGVNQFFFLRYPSVIISNYVAQLLSFPMGQLWAKSIPKWKVFGHSLNPGPFTVKEHVLVTIMATICYQSAYDTDLFALQKVYYHETFDFGYQWMVLMSTQLIGFSLGGIIQRFLVEPSSMIWPANLINCALFNTLHAHTYTGMGTHEGLSRSRFFMYVWFGSLCWYFLPGYVFQALSSFSWVCWIAPDNIVINQLFGYRSGLGMSLITFDWAQIAYILSPLASPWWAEANVMAGFFVFFWILAPVLHFSNVWYGLYVPMHSQASFDNTGSIYNVSRILTAQNQLNLTAYQEYSPLFLPTTYALSYGLSFASVIATVFHAVLFLRKRIWTQARGALYEQPDIHAHLMSKYSKVPGRWYVTIFVVMFALGVVGIKVWSTDFPAWGFVLALMIAFIFIIPAGMIRATTNQLIGLNIITELIGGYAIPGSPLAVVMFKFWGSHTVSHALRFASDHKLGHYMKIPPRTMFWFQVVATLIAGTVQLGVQTWMFGHISDLCTSTQKDDFVCTQMQILGVSSIIWGAIGPQRQFSGGQIYSGLVWFFLVGAICPILAWIAQKIWPNSWVRYINFPVIFQGPTLIPSAAPVNYVTWGIVGFIFQYVIRRRYFSWWAKYNYILSAALDTGLACSVVIFFFCLQFPFNDEINANTIAKWWGNTVFLETADGLAKPVLEVKGKFGPSRW